jgi:hypothetical protein
LGRKLLVGVTVAGLLGALWATPWRGTNEALAAPSKPETSDTHLRATWVCAGTTNEGLVVNVFNASTATDNYVTTGSKFYEQDGDSITLDSDKTGSGNPLDAFETRRFDDGAAASGVIVVTTDAFYVSAFDENYYSTAVPCTRVSVVKA